MLQTTSTARQENVFLLNKVIDLPRISLRPLHPFFDSFIHDEFTNEIARCMYRQPCNTFIDTKQRMYDDINKILAGELSSFIICKNNTGYPIGCATLHHKKVTPKIELWIAKKEQKKGYGTEAVFALKKFAKENLRKHTYLTAIVSTWNDPAIRLMNKLRAELQDHLTYKTNEAGVRGKLITYKLHH